MTLTECQNKIYAGGEEGRMEAAVYVFGIIILGILGVLLLFMDRSFIFTVHIIWIIYTYFQSNIS